MYLLYIRVDDIVRWITGRWLFSMRDRAIHILQNEVLWKPSSNSTYRMLPQWQGWIRETNRFTNACYHLLWDNVIEMPHHKWLSAKEVDLPEITGELVMVAREKRRKEERSYKFSLSQKLH